MTKLSKIKLVFFYKNIAIYSPFLKTQGGWDNTWMLFRCFLALETEKSITLGKILQINYFSTWLLQICCAHHDGWSEFHILSPPLEPAMKNKEFS